MNSFTRFSEGIRGGKVGFDLLSTFDDSGSGGESVTQASEHLATTGSRLLERALLFAVILCIIGSAITASLDSSVLWILGYVFAVLFGVTALGFYRQKLSSREQDLFLLVTKLERSLLVAYALALFATAAINALRLSVFWSGP